jgi:branched-chain amino acid transport system ATP-binding protein
VALLEVTDLKTGYGSLPVLGGISLSVDKGETVVLLGLNGAGKTTTVLTLAGLHKPWSGRIVFDGVDITGMEPRKLVAAGVVLVPEGRQVFPGLTVAQNLRLGAWPHKRDRSGSAAVVDRAVEYFPRLKERWSQLAGTLSGGEQQMLALARGLMARPKLMLIDEASLGLSPKLALTVFEVARKINEEGTTVFLVEQNAGVLSIADRALVMEKGMIVYEGSGRRMLDHASIRDAYLGSAH